MKSGAPRERLGGILEDFDPEHPDAHLIAAAPEMLAALEAVKGILPSLDIYSDKMDETLKQVCAAINKAKGVQG